MCFDDVILLDSGRVVYQGPRARGGKGEAPSRRAAGSRRGRGRDQMPGARLSRAAAAAATWSSP